MQGQTGVGDAQGRLTSGRAGVNSSARSSGSATPCGRFRRRRTLAPTEVGKRAAIEGRHPQEGLQPPDNTRGNHMVRARGLAVLIVATFVAFACGNTGGGTSSKGTIDIGSDLPTSGADASSGLPTQYGAAFAVSQKGTVKGFTLHFVPYDDAVNGKHEPRRGAQNVQQMISDTKLLGMVGPFNSGVAAAEIPVANQAPLALISPSNTNECLTLAFDDCQKDAANTAAAWRATGNNNYLPRGAHATTPGPP